MRPASRKFGYARPDLGEWVERSRKALGWSYRRLSSEIFSQTGVMIHAGTLLHIERNERSLPAAQRRALARTLNTATRAALPHRPRITIAHSLPAPEASPNEALSWAEEHARAHALALAAGQAQDWEAWARYTLETGMVNLTMGRLKTSARLLDSVLAADARLIGQDMRAQTYVHRGWLAMEEARFPEAVVYLRRGGVMLAREGQEIERVFHFLGRVYCAWGVLHDDAKAREAGRRYLTRALGYDKQSGAVSAMGYDLIQQVTSLIHDDPGLARRYLSWSKELLGFSGTPRGHYYLNMGRLTQETAPAQARESFERARDAYSDDVFYPKGLGSALRSLSALWGEDRETLPDAASHALVAALIHPYQQSLDQLEFVAMRVFITLCDNVESKYTTFWRAQGERMSRMSETPFTLLRGLLATASGSASLQSATTLAEGAIRRGAPEWASMPGAFLRVR